MVYRPDAPGPGEFAGLDHLQTESNFGPIPDGEMPGTDPLPSSSFLKSEAQPLDSREASYTSDLNDRIAIRRTGTDRDALPVVRFSPFTDQHEAQTTCCIPQENEFDLVQDDSGPQSDQG